jgi:2-polyprenyl-3-methyl-5-hydroxy-6-metoxy-1,4-benzoquinol methylase
METDKIKQASEIVDTGFLSPIIGEGGLWPPEDLEDLRGCPTCLSSERTSLHRGVVDRVSFCSKDHWNLWRCGNCECGYLSPRPNRSSVGRAYSRYYTHSAGNLVVDEGPLKGAYRSLRRIYEMGQRGESKAQPALTRLAAYCMGMFLHRRWELRARMYPRRTGERLLDVGCGSGDYLEVATSVGWKAEGIDPDPRAVDGAKARGLEVRLADLESEARRSPGTYDAITMRHVIEHFHDPIAALKACHSLLRLGGRIWIATPRLGCSGHNYFGDNWRGLEVPRHLVLFDEKSLSFALKVAGFNRVVAERVGKHAMFYWVQSYAISKRKDPYLNPPPLPFRLKLAAWYEDICAVFSAQAGEQIYMRAERG